MLCFRAEVFQVVIHYHVHICDDLQIVILISHHYPGQKITKKTTKKQSLNTDKTAQCLKIEKKVSFYSKKLIFRAKNGKSKWDHE